MFTFLFVFFVIIYYFDLKFRLYILLFPHIPVFPTQDTFYFPAENMAVNRTLEQFPPHLLLPMMLMRENMRKSVMLECASLDLSMSSRSKLKPTADVGAEGFVCNVCSRTYKLKSSLRNHQKWECGKEPQFKCPYCSYKAKQKMHMARHMERMHRVIDYTSVKTEIKTEPKDECDEKEDHSSKINVDSDSQTN